MSTAETTDVPDVLTDDEIERVLNPGNAPDFPEPPERSGEAPGNPGASGGAPGSAPRRGPGRPKGSRNKPKSPSAPGAPPPPPRARPRTAPRRGAKTPTTEQRILAAWGIPVALAGVAGHVLDSDAWRADAITLDHYGAGVAGVLAPIADQSPKFMALLDRMSGDAAPWVAAAMVGISMTAQLAVNHGLIQARTMASFGAVPREAVLGQPDPAAPPAPPAAPGPGDSGAPPVPADPWSAGAVPPAWQ